MSAAPKTRVFARHGAKFSKSILPVIYNAVAEHADVAGPMLDPMGGIGSLASIEGVVTATGEVVLPFKGMITGDLEWEWVKQSPRPAVQLDVHHLPFRDASVAVIADSPTYGNRFSDHHNAQDGSRRNGYAFWLREVGAEPRPNNSGLLHFGPQYKAFHIKAWREVRRVLMDDALFILNVSDFIKQFRRVRVVDFHRRVCKQLGFELVAEFNVPTPRMRDGANSELRVDGETVFVFRRPAR